MMDHAIAVALKSTAAPALIRRHGWITRQENSSRDTSLPDDLAAWFYDDVQTSTPPIGPAVDSSDSAGGAQESFSVLDRLAKLGPNWDGDRATAPAPLAISNAALAALQLETRGLKHLITADVDGGVIIKVRHPTTVGRFAALSCDNEGDAYLILEAPPEAPFVRKVDDSEGIGPVTLDEISNFLSR